ncbi:hypothetical protein JOD54_004211 [Actinokineospora baliensis]|uniref:hypothetical protein n=1 Tax=Actinokineospora baliensis TaxID=547056 RepID=UPI00195E0FA5|nr:hypothetical protein [Actinokineospora baliensis]MBM7774007.1 hypothetical protein [Actinokineospora baliensis]
MIVVLLLLYVALCVGHSHPLLAESGHLVATEVVADQPDSGSGGDDCGSVVHDPDAVHTSAASCGVADAVVDVIGCPSDQGYAAGAGYGRPPPLWGRTLLTHVCVART